MTISVSTEVIPEMCHAHYIWYLRLYYRQRDKAKQTDGTPVSLFNFFISRCRDQLHIVLAMSPIGDAFRDRLRKFPSLVNCCTIDWFQVGIDNQ